MQNLLPTTQQRLYDHLGKRFKLTPQTLMTRGTSLLIDPERDADGLQELWSIGEHTVIQTHPQHAPIFEAALKNDPLTAADIQGIAEDMQIPFYAIDEGCLNRISPPDGFHSRQAIHTDKAQFRAFLSRCSNIDKSEAQVGLNDDVVFAVFSGERIVSAASTFEWFGFLDVGVLTDPAYRRKGLGKAVVAAISAFYLAQKDESRLLLYRHRATNIGSQKTALAVGYQPFATVDYLRSVTPKG